MQSKDFSNSNNLTPNLKSEHEKDPSEYAREIVVDKPKHFLMTYKTLLEIKTMTK